jgi:hypothetical protein
MHRGNVVGYPPLPGRAMAGDAHLQMRDTGPDRSSYPRNCEKVHCAARFLIAPLAMGQNATVRRCERVCVAAATNERQWADTAL